VAIRAIIVADANIDVFFFHIIGYLLVLVVPMASVRGTGIDK